MHGVPRNQAKVSIPVQQDQHRQNGKTNFITEPTAALRPEALQAKTNFHQDKMYYLSPFKLDTVGSLPTFVLEEEDRGHYKYISTTTIGGDPESELSLAHTHTRTDLLRLFFLCTSSSIASRGNPPHHTRVGY